MNDIDFFKKNGYAILENTFTSDDCKKIIEDAYKAKDSESDFTPLMNPHSTASEILSSMKNKKIVSFIEEYFNGRAMGLQTEFFFMPPGTKGFSPHQDNTFVQADSNSFISAWIALKDVKKINGSLIIWPNTHEEEQLETRETGVDKHKNQDPNANKHEAVIPNSYKPKSVELNKGSVLMIDKWLVHASHDNLSNENRYSLLCTYIKEGSNFRAGRYAQRKSFTLHE